MEIDKNPLGVVLIKPDIFVDNRGIFSETYNFSKYFEAGIIENFLQDNFSASTKAGTLRGLHFQLPPYAQAKIVRCTKGSIFDVAVDIRRQSSTFGEWCGYELTAENSLQLYIPEGFAHGFVTLEDNSEVAYKCSSFYTKGAEAGIIYNDSDIAINWPSLGDIVLNEKDRDAPSLKDIVNLF